ncbi:MAG: 50S ribosomal protein L30 [Deltaproteobacteria bacterium]|nr:MAG: 50S ribosomal protein L30 [Deltaproteobacteria bacterium]
MGNVKTIRVRQVRSKNGASKRQIATIRGLGLGRVGQTRELADTPAVRGMIAKVAHLVQVEE